MVPHVVSHSLVTPMYYKDSAFIFCTSTSSKPLSSSSRNFPRLLSKLTCANWTCKLCCWQASLKTWVWRMPQVCWLSSGASPHYLLPTWHMLWVWSDGYPWIPTPFQIFRSWFTVAPKLIIMIMLASYTNIAWTRSQLSSATHNLLWIASTGAAIWAVQQATALTSIALLLRWEW